MGKLADYIKAKGLKRLDELGQTVGGWRPEAKPTQKTTRPVVAVVTRAKLPCAFLGEPTGQHHKVGCVNAYLDEHVCLCSERTGKLSRRGNWLPPRAIPGGRCRDLDGVILRSCLDCPLYRAGLLSFTPPAV